MGMPGAISCSTAFICPVYGPCNPKSVNSAIMVSARPPRQRLATSQLVSVIPSLILRLAIREPPAPLAQGGRRSGVFAAGLPAASSSAP